MYSYTDLSVIFNPYFTLIDFKSKEFTIKSNNTGHTWRIYESSDGFYGMFHKHKDKQKFHFHFAYESLQDCFLEIAGHDSFELNGRRNVRSSEHSFFDDIIRMYTSNGYDFNSFFF